MGEEYIGTTVRYTKDAPLRAYSSGGRIVDYMSLMLRSFFMCLSSGARILLADLSAFDNNWVFAMISIVASTATMVVFSVMLMAEAEPLERNSYTMLSVFKFIGSFSAFLAPFSLLMVILLPVELNWIGFFVACAMLGLLVTCFRLDDQRDVTPSVFNGLILYPLMVVTLWSLFAPPTHPGINLIMYQVIKVCLCIETAYHLITYLMFIYEKTRKPKAIQQQDQKKNNIIYTRTRLSYLMPLQGSSI